MALFDACQGRLLMALFDACHVFFFSNAHFHDLTLLLS
jgi:hypothetical protein